MTTNPPAFQCRANLPAENHARGCVVGVSTRRASPARPEFAIGTGPGWQFLVTVLREVDMQGPPLQIIVLPVASGNTGWARREPRRPYPAQPRPSWPKRQPIPTTVTPSTRQALLADARRHIAESRGGSTPV
jgi:hypothetical protein